jgi:hypothetical protein
MMAQWTSHLPSRRSEWTVRIMTAVITIGLGVIAITFSLAQTVARANSELAHSLAPYDGRITAFRAATLIATPEATAADRLQADALARRALRQDPTAVTAASTLGISAELRGDAAAAGRWFGYAYTLSRRDPQTQLWMIEDAVARNDIPGALRQYDIALRTKPVLANTLFPVLASASGEPAIRMELIRTLAHRPPWASEFLHYAAGNSPDPQSLVALFVGLRRANVPVPVQASNFAINALVGKGLSQEAWTYYAALHPGAARNRSRDPDFRTPAEEGSVLDWKIPDGGTITATLEPGGFDFAAPAGMGGSLLEQGQLLPAGRYRLSGQARNIVAPAGSGPYWVLSCADGRELGRVDMPASQVDKGRFAGQFTVPRDCPVQTLRLVTRATDAIAGQTGHIDRVELQATS